MLSRFIRTVSSTTLCLALLGIGGQAEASVESGKALAIEACSACHQVVASQKKPPPVANPDEGMPVQAPTFVAIAEHCASADQLRSKIANPHYPMREQLLGAIDMDALSAYIRSLVPVNKCPVH